MLWLSSSDAACSKEISYRTHHKVRYVATILNYLTKVDADVRDVAYRHCGVWLSPQLPKRSKATARFNTQKQLFTPLALRRIQYNIDAFTYPQNF